MDDGLRFTVLRQGAADLRPERDEVIGKHRWSCPAN